LGLVRRYLFLLCSDLRPSVPAVVLVLRRSPSPPLCPISSGHIIPRMKKTTLIVLFVLFLLPIVGCDDIAKQAGYVPAKTSAKPTPAPAPRHPIHRFVLTQSGGVALDTQTGQICKTWDWEPIGKQPAPDPVSGTVAPRAFGEFSPTCISLYNSYPTTGTEPQEL